MLNIIKKFLTHELISGAGIIFISSSIANIFNFFFNLFMSRNLSVSDYGVFASLVSLMTLSSLPASAVIPTVINFAASYFAKKDLVMVRGLFLKVTRLSSVLGIIVFVFFFIFSKDIGQFFNINNNWLIILAGLNVLLGFIAVVNNPLLQAKLAFPFISFLNILTSFLKLGLGVIFVFMGFAVGGAVWALFFSTAIPYAISFVKLRFLFHKGEQAPHIRLGKLFGYGAPAALASFGLTSFVTTDIILVKHFFDPSSAGIYAGISLVGRVIFYFSASIAMVMFPLVTQRHTRKENYDNIFKLSMLLVFLPSIFITFFYFIYPEFSINFFTREVYTQGASYLGLFGIFVTVYSLLSVITNFYLSIRKTEIFIPILIAALAQGVFIWFFHKSFFEIITISLCIASLLLFLLLLYYWHLYGKENKK